MKLLALLLLSVGGLRGEETRRPSFVDMSHAYKVPWDGLDMEEAKSEVLGVIHQATEGTSYRDTAYTSTKHKAEREDLLWGAYHIGIGGKSGVEQAEHFLRTVGSWRDHEKTLLVLYLKGRDMSVSEAEDFVTKVKNETGRLPLLYGNHIYLENYQGSSILRQCHLWLPTFDEYSVMPSPWIPRGWTSWVLWQYTDGKHGARPRYTKGIGNTGRSWYNGSLEQLKKKWPDL